MRVKASACGLVAEEYRAELTLESGWTGMAELEVETHVVDDLYENGSVELTEAGEFPTHTGLVMLSDRGSALGRVMPDKRIRLVRGDREAFGIRGRSAEQRVALDLLLDPDVGIISLGGRAGTGKSALALCAGLESVMERRQHKKVDRLPAAVRGRRAGARISAGQRGREDGAVGTGRLRHARRADQ